MSVVYNVGSWRLSEDGCILRRGRLRYANGDVYDGEWKNGKRHGKGMLTFAQGGSYAGAFEADFFHGYGVLAMPRWQPAWSRKWVRGETYEGSFRRGLRHGNGTLRTSAGDVYDGVFEDGYYQGQGTCTYANGDMYIGAWVHGKWQGSGEYRLRDGSTYIGEFLQGRFHGYGKYLCGSAGKGGSYDGDYRGGQRHGKGRRVFPDGRTYEGDWRDDEMHGVGVLECDQFKYVGEFEQGKFHGRGVMSFRNGDSYEGEFAKGEIAGVGAFSYRDGGTYEGEFQAGRRHGHGKRVFSTGGSYEGDWVDDQMHGHGVLVKQDRVTTAKRATTIYRYDGAFVHGMQTGTARITYEYSPEGLESSPTSDRDLAYEFPVGSSCWHYGIGESRYVGSVLRGELHGQGLLESPDGKLWRGEWKHGKLDGEGECIYLPLTYRKLRDQAALDVESRKKAMVSRRALYGIVQYEGEFRAHVRHGRGCVLFETGDSIAGMFERGFAHGVVLYRYFNGKERHAEFNHGQRVRWLSEEEEERLRVAEEDAREIQEAQTSECAAVLRVLAH